MKHLTQAGKKKHLTEKNLPDSVKVVLTHFHKGNSSRSMRKGHKYMTLCRLYDRETHIAIGHGESHCSGRDLPNRKIGRHVAIGRAMKEAGLGTYTDNLHTAE